MNIILSRLKELKKSISEYFYKKSIHRFKTSEGSVLVSKKFKDSIPFFKYDLRYTSNQYTYVQYYCRPNTIRKLNEWVNKTEIPISRKSIKFQEEFLLKYSDDFLLYLLSLPEGLVDYLIKNNPKKVFEEVEDHLFSNSQWWPPHLIFSKIEVEELLKKYLSYSVLFSLSDNSILLKDFNINDYKFNKEINSIPYWLNTSAMKYFSFFGINHFEDYSVSRIKKIPVEFFLFPFHQNEPNITVQPIHDELRKNIELLSCEGSLYFEIFKKQSNKIYSCDRSHILDSLNSLGNTGSEPIFAILTEMFFPKEKAVEVILEVAKIVQNSSITNYFYFLRKLEKDLSDISFEGTPLWCVLALINKK